MKINNEEILFKIFDILRTTNFNEDKCIDMVLNLIFLHELKRYDFTQHKLLIDNNNELKRFVYIMNDIYFEKKENRLKYFQNNIIPFLMKGTPINENVNLFYRNIHQTFDGFTDSNIFNSLIELISQLNLISSTLKDLDKSIEKFRDRNHKQLHINNDEIVFDSICDFIVTYQNSKIADFRIDNSIFLNKVAQKINTDYLIKKENDVTKIKKDTSSLVGFGVWLPSIKRRLLDLSLNNALDVNIQWKSPIIDYGNINLDNRFDSIFTLPPFRARVQNEDIHKENYPIETRSEEGYYIQKVLKSLNRNGKAAIIVPNAMLFNLTNSEKDLRKMILPFISLIVHFPNTFFKNSSINTSLIMIDKSNTRQHTIFADFSNEKDDYHNLFSLLSKSIYKNLNNQVLEEYISIIEHNQIQENQFVLNVNRYRSMDEFLEQKKDPKSIIKSIFENNESLSDSLKLLNENLSSFDNEVSIKRTYKFDEICNITVGRRPLPKDSIIEGNIPFFNITDITNNDNYLLSTSEVSINEEFAFQNHITLVSKNSVLFSIRGTIGTVAIANKRIAISPTLVSFELNNEIVDPIYLYQWLKDKKNYFESIATGSTIKAINRQQLNDIEIELPPLHIQREFAQLKIEMDNTKKYLHKMLQNTEELTSSLLSNKY